MEEVDIDHLRTWIGRERTVEDVITPRLAASLNAVFDVEEPVTDGMAAPLGIHWCLAPDIVPMKGLGADGHPARGGFLPPVPFPRRMWAGGRLTFFGDFRVGDTVSRRSVIEDVVLKTGRSGDMIFVTLRHDYATPRGIALEERQDIVYRKMETGGPVPRAEAKAEPPVAMPSGDAVVTLSADPVLLFRYSAITFNGHRIHYDKPYATDEEAYPGLVFHGPLQASYLLRFSLDPSTPQKTPRSFSFRSVKPLFAGGEVTLHRTMAAGQVELRCADQSGRDTMLATASLT
ncbi:3-methylfumaryl-CoA hydratase [Rhizobium aquaticum]|uniref:3-methylfumaryl-CoA hydratase n=1 Tax=Rhizobium aquaticum TaxID=1549636 RepID=A0ABV2J5U0_9HYPH